MPKVNDTYGTIIKKRFGKNLRDKMEERSLDATGLADEMGISRQNVWRYTQGRMMPAWDTYAALCAKLRVDPTDLLKES